MIRTHIVLVSLLALAAAGCGTPDGSEVDAARVAELFLESGIKNARAPQPGVLTSGQPTEEQFDALDDVGIATVICLRDPGEQGTGWEEERAADSGVVFIRMPVSGRDGITSDNAADLHARLEAAEGPVLVCCGSSNRVGALFAIAAHEQQDMEPEAALQFGKEHGLTKLEPAVRAQLGMED